MFFFFLISGLFLGWSLGANDAANVYGTAVGTKMIRFTTAAVVCSVFVLIGAVFGGEGASHTLGKLGAVNALSGSFTVALAAALTVTWMTRLKLPVSTSQAVVGAIIGWNFFSGSLTDYNALTKIVSSWVLCPVLAAGFAIVLLKLTDVFLRYAKLHMFTLDGATRIGLLVAGAFASYSLGANNIANVMGVFVPAAPFSDLDLFGMGTLSAAQQLFLLGAVAIGVGVFTYSKRVMLTVGNDLFRMSSLSALTVVLSQAIVLFLFSSEGLENWLASHGLPTIPLVPVSSSQAVIGAVIGIGLMKGGRNIQFRVLGKIASGWVSTPILAGLMAFVLLFFVQNVFSQQVYSAIPHKMSPEVVAKMKDAGVYNIGLGDLVGQEFPTAVAFRDAVAKRVGADSQITRVVALAAIEPLRVDMDRLGTFRDHRWYSEEQLAGVRALQGNSYAHTWQLEDTLAAGSEHWRFKPASTENKLFNKDLRAKLDHLRATFREGQD